MNFKGTQVAMDMYNCILDVIDSQDKVKEVLENAAKEFKMEVRNIYHNPSSESDDYAYIMLCASGNIDIYVFPSLGYCAVDIFTAEDTANPEQLAIYIRKQFAPDQSKLTMLNRGDFGSISDMKPRRKKQVRPIRRAKNALKKLVVTPKD